MCGISCWTTRWVKPLDKVYEAFPEYNSQNVLIIDDTESTYCKNEENAIPISYWWEGREDDKLSQISDFLIYDLKDLPDVRSFQNKKNYGRLNTKIVDV
jgi:TFIIF-interacting CTD phosphatase-like protein